MTCSLRPGGGPMTWSMTRDEDGHRNYKVKFRVFSDDRSDTPDIALTTPGLPQPGDWWLIGNGNDTWAWCLPTCSVNPVVTSEPNYYWEVESQFSTKPPSHNGQRCNDVPIQDPILEPPKVSGSFVKYTEEASYDRFGLPIITSSFEQLRGPKVEFDKNRANVKIEFNVAQLDIGYFGSFVDTVNQYPLWGFNPRCVKLSSFSWDRKYYGQCYVYYALKFEFDTNTDTFDRNILDEGTKALNGENRNGVWHILPINGAQPNRYNPMHFVRYKDAHGENCKVILNGFGLPAGHVSTTPSPGVPPSTDYYVCVEANTGQATTNKTYWLKQVGGDNVWDINENYVQGNLVVVDWGGTSGDQTYICAIGNKGISPTQSGSTTYWVFLPTGVNSKGNWVSTTTYVVGDQVVVGAGIPPGTGTIGGNTSAGFVHVEKYDEADMLLLGIPSTF